MKYIKQIFLLIWKHKEWLFSGIGLTIISSIFSSNKIENVPDDHIETNDIKIEADYKGDIYENSIINNYNTINTNHEKNNTEKSIIMSESKYLEYLNSIVDNDVIYHYYSDYDGDGSCEMFALVGETRPYTVVDEEEKNLYGKIWFINEYGAVEVESDDIEYWESPYVFSVDGNVFITFEQAFTTGSLTYIWGVKNGEPYQPNISKKGNGLKINEFNEIEITHSTYDMMYMDEIGKLGHTWKKYYFYFDGRTFREYGGMKISVSDILNIPNGNMIINEINNKSCEIDSIFYRSNGIININISKEFKHEINYYTITIRYDGDNWSFVQSEFGRDYGRGTYLKEMIPSAAISPKEYPY